LSFDDDDDDDDDVVVVVEAIVILFVCPSDRNDDRVGMEYALQLPTTIAVRRSTDDDDVIEIILMNYYDGIFNKG
jgi:hypothetical protein